MTQVVRDPGAILHIANAHVKPGITVISQPKQFVVVSCTECGSCSLGDVGANDGRITAFHTMEYAGTDTSEHFDGEERVAPVGESVCRAL